MSLSLASLLLSSSSLLASAPTILRTDVGPSRCEIWDSTKQVMQALAPEQTEVRAILTDGIAEVEVIQTFVSNFAKPAEAKYVFPLPHQGAVHGMKYRQDGKWRKAEILPKEKADSLYDSIKTAGGTAARLTQQRPDIFTQSMTKITPGDTVEVRITLSMPLKYKDGSFEFAFPTMIGARCCNESTPPIFGTIAGWNPPADVEGPRIRFIVGIQTGYGIQDISSPTHAIRSISALAAVDTLVGRGLLKGPADLPLAFRNAVLLQPLNTFPNSDFVLRFSRISAEFQASSATWSDTTGGKYFRLEVFPDGSWSQGERPDMDVMMLVDRSGSQQGWPMEHEKAISKQIMNRLRTTDRLCVMSFDNINELAFVDTLRYASGANVAQAATFVDALTARGGTELAGAIKALTAIPNPTNRHRLFVFLTDGFITNEAEILSHLSSLPDLQVITFGAGDNLNRAFLDETALIGNGFSTPLVQNDDLVARVDEAWSRIESPALGGLHLDTKGLVVTDLHPQRHHRLQGNVVERAGSHHRIRLDAHRCRRIARWPVRQCPCLRHLESGCDSRGRLGRAQVVGPRPHFPTRTRRIRRRHAQVGNCLHLPRPPGPEQIHRLFGLGRSLLGNGRKPQVGNLQPFRIVVDLRPRHLRSGLQARPQQASSGNSLQDGSRWCRLGLATGCAIHRRSRARDGPGRQRALAISSPCRPNALRDPRQAPRLRGGAGTHRNRLARPQVHDALRIRKSTGERSHPRFAIDSVYAFARASRLPAGFRTPSPSAPPRETVFRWTGPTPGVRSFPASGANRGRSRRPLQTDSPRAAP
ncbi:MAG: VWA domain-containing protein [Fibrobacterota bacterium]|nr:MAG: VWA domain-containing protein [Fibrobacterota bacterium]